MIFPSPSLIIFPSPSLIIFPSPSLIIFPSPSLIIFPSASLIFASFGLFAGLSFAKSSSQSKKTSCLKLPSQKSLYVDGKHIPGISNMTGDLGPSYAGLLPITAKSTDKEFFFWYWPTERDDGKDDLVIWLNGGPGCSSLEDVFEENGPLTLTEPTKNVYKAVKNPYSWHHLSDVIWIEQPVSTGFDTGTPDVTNEEGIAKEFYGFLLNLYKVFPEFKSKKLWITGESYAGMYIPYITDYIYKQDNKLNLQGFSVNDPAIVNLAFGEDIPALDFARVNQKTLQLNSSDLAILEQNAVRNGISGFVEKHLVFPPKGKIYAPKKIIAGDQWTYLYNLTQHHNKCFSAYYIDDKCPADLDPLGTPLDSTANSSSNNFINRTPGFKKYVHATDKTWLECSIASVFAGNGIDNSLAPADSSLLGRVMTKNRRTVIQHGLLDMVLLSNGTLLGIQNTTWSDAGSGGKSKALQGFQKNFFANKGNLKVDGKSTGQFIHERGVTFVTVDKAGHLIPKFTPATAYKLQKYLLGQIKESDLLK